MTENQEEKNRKDFMEFAGDIGAKPQVNIEKKVNGISPEEYKTVKKKVQDIIDLMAYIHPGFTILKIGQVMVKALKDIEKEKEKKDVKA